MALPLKLKVEGLSQFCICKFKDLKYKHKSKPHYYVSIPISDNSYLLLCMITSKAGKKENLYRYRPEAENSLVTVDKHSLTCLRTISTIDCNRPELILKGKLIQRIDSNYGISIVISNIPKAIKEEIITAVKNSPLIKPAIKKLIKN